MKLNKHMTRIPMGALKVKEDLKENEIHKSDIDCEKHYAFTVFDEKILTLGKDNDLNEFITGTKVSNLFFFEIPTTFYVFEKTEEGRNLMWETLVELVESCWLSEFIPL